MPRQRRSRFQKTDAQHIAHQLEQVDALVTRGRHAQAYPLLKKLAAEHPEHVGVLSALSGVAYGLHDAPVFLMASERLSRLLPDDPDVLQQLAGAYLQCERPALALRTFRRFAERWPRHVTISRVRQSIAVLEASLSAMLAEIGLADDDALEVAALHEEVQAHLYAGRYAEGHAAAERLLQRAPHFAPALNNRSLMYWLEGQSDQAISTAEHVIAFDPGNIHALGNLTRFNCLQGRVEAAREWATRLKASTASAVDRPLKLMEALSYLGDDQGVLEAFRPVERSSRRSGLPLPALMSHLAAVASLRIGHADQARRLWRRVLRDEPTFAFAQANMDDLRQPVGERHAPWAFSLQYLLAPALLTELAATLQTTMGQDEQASAATIQQFVQAHPQLAGLVPLWLDRGDPQARELGMRLAMQAKTPELLAALRDFALGQRGPDHMRMDAAEHASTAGLLPKGLVRMWIAGEWRELMLLNFEIHEEPPALHSLEVEALLHQALALLRRGDPLRAERLLHQALAVEPDAPDLANNLAVAWERQGRTAEAEALLQANHERHPDYVLGAIAVARLRLQRGEIDSARALLDSLLTPRRLHLDDLAALCAAEIDLYLADDQPDAARSWLDIWASADPEHPALAGYRRQLRQDGAATRRHALGGQGRARRHALAAREAEPQATPPALPENSERAETVPKQLRPIYEQIVSHTDAFCREHLDEEYAALSRRMAAALSRKRPSPLLQGRPQSWACAIVYAVGRVNFLFDRSQTPHLSAGELCSRCGVSQATASAKAKQILDSLKIGLMDPQWSRRSLVDKNPMAWMLEVNGQIVDARDLPRDLQEEAFRRGLIPYLPEQEG